MSLQMLYEELKGLVKKAYFDEGLERKGSRTIRTVMGEVRGLLPANFKIDLGSEVQIKSAVLLAECYDYYGQFPEAASISQSGKMVLSTISPTGGKIESEGLIQAKIRLAVACARSLYRAADYDNAERLLVQCRAGTKLFLKGRPNFGVLGEIAYTLGRVHRQRQGFVSALHEFNTAIEMYNKRAEEKRRSHALDAQEAEGFSAHKVATIVALGVAWCNYTQGSLSAATYGNLIPARMLLKRSGDILNSAYADVVYASTARALAGRNAQRLAELSELVQKAQDVFRRYGHAHYVAGTALELALIALASGDNEEAKEQLRILEEPPVDERWLLSARIVQSRLYRRTGDRRRALDMADEAFRIAKDRREFLAEIDALIARSEARSNEEHDLAVSDLLKAVNLNQTADGRVSSFNPKVHAICHLHLAQRYLMMERLSDAYASFTEWIKVRKAVEHANIHEQAAGLAAELGLKEELFIDTSKLGLNYSKNDAVLREFLLRKAEMKYRTQQEIVRALGIAVPTLNKWKEQFE